jgi:hypothetical protein
MKAPGPGIPTGPVSGDAGPLDAPDDGGGGTGGAGKPAGGTGGVVEPGGVTSGAAGGGVVEPEGVTGGETGGGTGGGVDSGTGGVLGTTGWCLVGWTFGVGIGGATGFCVLPLPVECRGSRCGFVLPELDE